MCSKLECSGITPTVFRKSVVQNLHFTAPLCICISAPLFQSIVIMLVIDSGTGNVVSNSRSYIHVTGVLTLGSKAPFSHSRLQPRSTRTQQSWSIVVSLQIIFNSRTTVWRVCTSRIEVSGGYDCFESFKTVVVDRRHLHKQVRANR